MIEDPSYQYDIFVSYSSLDGEWVRGKLVPALRAAGLKVCIDRETFDSSTALQNIENAVAASRHTLLVLSRNWLGSEWTELESLLAQHADPTGKRSKAVPLLLERQVLRKLPLRIAILSHFDFSGRRSESEELDRLIQTLQGKVQRPREAGYGEAMDQRHRQTMVQRVEEFWIRGVLRQKLADRPQLTLGVLRHPAAVERPLNEALGESERPVEVLQREEDIFAAFQAADDSLLILGDPGSGKTTALLMLAREAIGAMRVDALAPVPVVFTLSSWNEKPIGEWLISELVTKYQIPAKFGEKWIENDQLLLLLDGLDEVPEELRAKCIGELRAFLSNHGLTQIAICSRTADYMRLAMPLQLQSAVILQPLTLEQLRTYLQAGDQRFAELEHLLLEDPVLRELAASPLMLSVMTSAFRDGAANYPQQGSLIERKSFVFDRYVEQALGRRTGELPFEREEFLRRLRWLARKMIWMGQTVFLVELLQPDWLTRGRLWYQSLVTAATLLLTHLPLLLLFAWSWFEIESAAAAGGEVVEAGGGFSLGLNVSMCLALYALTWARNLGPLARFDIQTVQSLGWSWESAGKITACVALGTFVLGSGLFVVLILSFLAAGFGVFVVAGTLSLLRFDREVVDKSSFWAGVTVFALGVAYGLGSLGYVYWVVLNSPEPTPELWNVYYVMLFFSPVVFLLSGLRWRGMDSIPERPTGMLPTARNALLVGLLTAAVIVATLYLISWRETEFAGVVSFAYLVGVGAALYFGGFALIKHLVLRGLLACQKMLPWRCRTMLNVAVDRALMQRAGSAYLFMHREMQEHLARQAPPEPEPSQLLERGAQWVERLSTQFRGGLEGDWFPPRWADRMANSKLVERATKWLLYVVCAAPLLAIYFFLMAPSRFSGNTTSLLNWGLALLLAATAGILGGAWRYFAGGIYAAWACASFTGMDDSLGMKIIATLIVMPIAMKIGTLIWGFFLDGLFSERS